MSMTAEQAAFLRDQYVQGLEQEQQSCLKVVRAMPDEKLGWKPEERIWSFGSLAMHIAGTSQFFLKVIAEGKVEMGAEPPPEPEVPPTTEALAGAVEGLFKAGIDGYRSFTPEQLAAEIPFGPMGALPGVAYIGWDVAHLIHHRAQLALYLRISGEKVPSIYGPTLDVGFDQLMEECGG